MVALSLDIIVSSLLIWLYSFQQSPFHSFSIMRSVCNILNRYGITTVKVHHQFIGKNFKNSSYNTITQNWLLFHVLINDETIMMNIFRGRVEKFQIKRRIVQLFYLISSFITINCLFAFLLLFFFFLKPRENKC